MTDTPRPSDSSVPTSVQAALGHGFQIERELGGGGMSRVFIATETAFGRKVAVKVLSPNLFEGVSVERFAREVAVAAQLQNPHIVPVLAAGTTAEGLPWYTMPFIEGESLRARMLRGVVPVDEAIQILRDVAKALEYAHGRGIVHRDIKPENVLLSGRSALVTDFGIAKAVSSVRDAASGGALTSVGLSLGTPAYMSPEQVAADPLDHRTDLYAWGIMAYEVLAGRHPFAERTQAQVMAAHVAEMPEDLAALRPELPAGLADLVMHCVAKLPADRPADAAALLAALGSQATPASLRSAAARSAKATGRASSRARILVAAATVLVLGAAAWTASGGKSPFAGSGEDQTPAVAVLPFEHQGDSADVYLTEGITDEIRNKLTGVRELVVIARSSSNAYRGTTKTARDIAEELGVRWLLTGTVRVTGSGAERRVIVRPELVEITKAGQPQSRWGQPFDVVGTDVLRLQGSVASQVVSAMEVPIAPGSDRSQLTELPTRDAVAYDLYLRARAATSFGADGSLPARQAAIDLLEQAVARDSGFVVAWASLTAARANLFRAVPSPQLAAAVKRAAERAMALDPDGPHGNRAMGVYINVVENDFQRALQFQERSVAADPNDVPSGVNLASTLVEIGRHDEGVALYESLLRRDPRQPQLIAQASFANLLLGRQAEARALMERLRSIAPTALTSANLEVLVAEFAGDSVGVRDAAKRALERIPANRLVPTFANSAMSWVFEPATVAAVLAQDADAIAAGERHFVYLWRADFAWLRGDRAAQRLWGDSARQLLARKVREVPRDWGLRSEYAQALAHAGNGAEAQRQNREALALILSQGVSRKGRRYSFGLESATVVSLYLDDHEAALAWLDELKDHPLRPSAGYFRVNPYYAPLRGNPRFEEIVANAR